MNRQRRFTDSVRTVRKNVVVRFATGWRSLTYSQHRRLVNLRLRRNPAPGPEYKDRREGLRGGARPARGHTCYPAIAHKLLFYATPTPAYKWPTAIRENCTPAYISPEKKIRSGRARRSKCDSAAGVWWTSFPPENGGRRAGGEGKKNKKKIAPRRSLFWRVRFFRRCLGSSQTPVRVRESARDKR